MQTKPLHLDVHEQIECAQTLASRFYTDPEILEIEKQRIFLRTWQLVGTLSQSCGEGNGTQRTIPDPESYFTTDVALERIKRAVAFSDEVQQEDVGLCEQVQGGLRSSTYDRGRYSVKRENGSTISTCC